MNTSVSLSERQNNRQENLTALTNDGFVDYLIDKAGGVGKAHVCFFFAVSSGINSIITWINFQLPFFIQRQEYRCEMAFEGQSPASSYWLSSADTSIDNACTVENICEGDRRILSWSVDYDHPRSLVNWQ